MPSPEGAPKFAAKFAIVTGASSGIGFELARLAATDGYDLLICADEPLIDAAAAFADFGVDVRSVEADLGTPDGVERLIAAAGERPVDILIANAGTGQGGAFLDQQFARWRHIVDTNITGTLLLVQRVAARMIARGQGRILVTGSIAGFVPGAFNAVYNATKAFIDNFVAALQNEWKDGPVTITNLLPGATDTEFFARAGMLDTKVGTMEKADAADVARDGWDALLAGEAQVVSGLKNKLTVAAARVTPASVLAEQHRKQAEPGTAE